MKTEVTKGEGHQVTLKVKTAPEDLDGIIDATYKDLGQRLKVPGFRKGKVPPRVIDSQVGSDNVRMEAIRNGLPTLYLMAVRDSGIFPVSDPELNLLETGEDGGDLVFEAKVDVKPEITVTDYKGVQIEKPDTEVKDEDVQQALDEARERFATLEVVESRPVEEGDFVLVDYKVFADGEPLEGSSGSDRMIEIGAKEFFPEFDEQLVGGRKGDIMDVVTTFPPDYGVRELAGKPGTFRTMIKEIKKKVLPPLDDDMAREMSRFESVDELKEDVRKQIGEIKKETAGRVIRERIIEALVDKTFVDVPESMVEHQVHHEIEEFSDELGERGITLDQYLEAMKGSRYELEKAIKDRVEDNLKAELILDAIATAEEIEVSNDEAEDFVRQRANAVGEDPEKTVNEARKAGRIAAVKANLRVSRAVDLLVENAVFEGGEPVRESIFAAGGPEEPTEIGESNEAPEPAAEGEKEAGEEPAEDKSSNERSDEEGV